MWLIVALALGFSITALVFWMRSKGIKMTWYEWLIGIVGLLLVLFAAQNFIEVSAELNSTAASRFLLYVGLPGLILMVVAWQLAVRKQKAS